MTNQSGQPEVPDGQALRVPSFRWSRMLDEIRERTHREATCIHQWSEPVRANNRFGRRSTSLYATICSACGLREVRNGLARLRREVINL